MTEAGNEHTPPPRALQDFLTSLAETVIVLALFAALIGYLVTT